MVLQGPTYLMEFFISFFNKNHNMSWKNVMNSVWSVKNYTLKCIFAVVIFLFILQYDDIVFMDLFRGPWKNSCCKAVANGTDD